MELFRLFIALGTIIFVGWNVYSVIAFKRNGLCLTEKLLVSYGMGMGFLSLEMLVFYLLKQPFDIYKLLLPWAGLFIINFILLFWHCNAGEGCNLSVKKGDRLLWKALAIFISFEIAYAFFRALIKPIEAYDAIAIYAIKSKIFYLANSIPDNFFGGVANLFAHPDYPINIPLIQTFLYTAMGSLNDQLVKLIFPLYFIGILGMVYFAIRRFASNTYALLFTFILASIPQFNAYAANAYNDLPLAFYNFTALIFMLKWFDDKKDVRFLILSAIMAGLGGWTKNEGLMYCVVNILLLIIFALINFRNIKLRELFLILLYIGIVLVITLPWTYIKKKYAITNNEVDLANINVAYLSQQLYKFKTIFYEFQKEFFGPKKWLLFWPVAASAIIYKFRNAISGTSRYIAIYLFLTISAYCLFYLVSIVDVHTAVGKTWSRFLLHFLPVVAYWVALLLKDEVKI